MENHFLINAILQKQQDIAKLYVELNEEIKKDLNKIQSQYPPIIIDITRITSEKPCYFQNTQIIFDFYIKFKTKFNQTEELKLEIKKHNEKFHYNTKYFEPIASTSYYWRDGYARSFSITKNEKYNDTIVEYPKFNIECSKEDFVSLRSNIVPLIFKTDKNLRAMRQLYIHELEHEMNFRAWKRSIK